MRAALRHTTRSAVQLQLATTTSRAGFGSLADAWKKRSQQFRKMKKRPQSQPQASAPSSRDDSSALLFGLTGVAAMGMVHQNAAAAAVMEQASVVARMKQEADAAAMAMEKETEREAEADDSSSHHSSCDYSYCCPSHDSGDY